MDISPSFFGAALAVSWWNYPLIELGDDSITVLTILKVVFWVVVIFGLNIAIRSLVLRRVLGRTRLARGLQFAIPKIFGYMFVILGFYVALVVNGVNLASLAVVGGALVLGIGFGLQNVVANFVSGLVLGPVVTAVFQSGAALCMPDPHSGSVRSHLTQGWLSCRGPTAPQPFSGYSSAIRADRSLRRRRPS